LNRKDFRENWLCESCFTYGCKRVSTHTSKIFVPYYGIEYLLITMSRRDFRENWRS